jgi:hypothetical protein
MPYRITRDGACRLLVKADGSPNLAESLAVIDALVGMRRDVGADQVLVDLRQSDYTPTFREVQTLADATGRKALGMSLALVVAGALHTGVARQFATFAGKFGIRVGVFADPDAAAVWLEADEPVST